MYSLKATLSTRNPKLTGLGSNPVLCSEREETFKNKPLINKYVIVVRENMRNCLYLIFRFTVKVARPLSELKQ